jgi:cyanophycinase
MQKFVPSAVRKTSRSICTLFKLFLFLSCNSYVYASEGGGGNVKYELLLAGGGLKTCSSMASQNCTKNNFSDDAKVSSLYQISQSNLEKFQATASFSQLPETQKQQINSVLVNIYAKYPAEVIGHDGFKKLFAQNDALTLFNGLSEGVYYALLDSFELPQMDKTGQRKRERISLADNKNHSSIEIYQTFVEQARMRMPLGQVKPKVAIVTASSRDAFEVADFYTAVFEQAGAEVIWLPLDKSYRQALALERLGFQGCQSLKALREQNFSFYREQIYPQRTAKQRVYCEQPQLMLNDINSVQGLFINGGDQSLTLASLKYSDGSDSDELALIRLRMKSGDLIVGGTSAGTAVQAGGHFNGFPIPMLSNGDADFAMARGAFANPPPSEMCKGNSDANCGQGLQKGDLTYLATGGTGLFTLGLLDTHFSERERETRLAVFSAQTKQRFAFGVDETTALLVANERDEQGKPSLTQLKVIGQNGMFMVDNSVSSYRRSLGMDGASQKVELSAIAHYLTNGSQASFDHNSMSWEFSLAGEALHNRHRLKVLESGVWRDKMRESCGQDALISWQQYSNHYVAKSSIDTQFYWNKSLSHCSYVNLPFVISFVEE